MPEVTPKLAQIIDLIESHVSTDGLHETALEHVALFRESHPQSAEHRVYDPVLVFAAQGKKHINLNGRHYEYGAGNFFAVFMPMAFECEIVDVSPEKPMLGVGIRLDRHRLAQLLLKMDGVDSVPQQPEPIDSSGLFAAPVSDELLDAVTRLLNVLGNPLEAAILGESIIDEIYYRVLSRERGGALRVLLRQHGEMQQISRVVEHLHENIDKNISVEELASLVHMSGSGFHKKFKDVMHVSPLQYIKSIRLNKARTFILEGVKASEAGYRVGYNSPAQFSREYKRQFGVAPSAT